MKKIFLGADHAGFKLKEVIRKYLESVKVPYEDLGAFKFNKEDDYPDYASRVAERVVAEKTRGILVCGSSIGVCIVANKFRGVYAAPVTTEREALLAVEHNNANVICLSGWNLSASKVKKILRVWLKTEYKVVVRHGRRMEKIKKIENRNFK